MRRGADPDEGLSEVLALWTAENAEALHQVLVLHPPVRQSSDAFEPMALLQKHHATEPATSATTAMLLLTDRRWQGGVSHLIRRIAESGILDEKELDFLASMFLAADDAVFWPIPDGWFSGETVSIALEPDGEGDVVDEDETEGPVVARREVWPPLRRWAAAHELQREPVRWEALLARVGQLKARHAAAVIAGLVDGIDALELDAQSVLIEQVVRWPEHGVRRQALELVVEREGPERAYALAKNDPSRRIRSWAESLRDLVPTADSPKGLGRLRRSEHTDPPTLF